MNYEFWDRLILRGLQAQLQDYFLGRMMEGPITESVFPDFLEAKHMAEQVFANLRGWTN